MTVRFIAQLPTVQFGYIRVEVEGDSTDAVYADFVTASTFAAEEAARAANPVTPQQAVSNLQQAGVVQQGNAGGGLPNVSAPPPWAATNGQEQAAYVPPQQTGGWQPSVQQQGSQAQQGPSCNHGARTYKSGTSGKGPWTAWFCPQPKGAPDQCKPIFN